MQRLREAGVAFTLSCHLRECRRFAQARTPRIVYTLARNDLSLRVVFVVWKLKAYHIRRSSFSLTHWVKGKNRGQAPIPLPQAATRVIQLPNLGSHRQFGAGPSGPVPPEGDGEGGRSEDRLPSGASARRLRHHESLPCLRGLRYGRGGPRGVRHIGLTDAVGLGIAPGSA